MVAAYAAFVLIVVVVACIIATPYINQLDFTPEHDDTITTLDALEYTKEYKTHNLLRKD